MAEGKTMALVMCSTRTPRLNPFIAAYVLDQLAPLLAGTAVAAIDTIDLADQQLPFYDEPVLPACLPGADPTPHALRPRAHAPLYNWSVPAVLKNALDFLFHEWKGKPAGIVSYGFRRGDTEGDMAAAHLQDVLTGLRMRPAPTAPGLITTAIMIAACTESGRVSEYDRTRWRDAGVEDQLKAMARELLQGL
ncbi:NAD(P)H-dependent FMN reductase LOT6 [Tolypocladium ophioglossoides CBS 100239]|uniref:NAD(P)H-dependent FMN reductase LOT6 n=1 Tax=Tolypocladium ophioglossoides (strain CBS 100239) TaxID=1163406 RepID=A0A0L0NDF9_TOLOC|nr:NAD(P)H-dependent FMN reductase LOT6 [Tolypocladium ophioglossoides CBS 100239]